jgi:hypothetical protein
MIYKQFGRLPLLSSSVLFEPRLQANMVNDLYKHPLFFDDVASPLSQDDRVARAYKRARIILQAHGALVSALHLNVKT